MFERNRHGQLVWIPYAEQLATEVGTTMDAVEDFYRLKAHRERAHPDGGIPAPPGFTYPALRAQDKGADTRPVLVVDSHQRHGAVFFGPINARRAINAPYVLVDKCAGKVVHRYDVDAQFNAFETPAW